MKLKSQSVQNHSRLEMVVAAEEASCSFRPDIHWEKCQKVVGRRAQGLGSSC